MASTSGSPPLKKLKLQSGEALSAIIPQVQSVDPDTLQPSSDTRKTTVVPDDGLKLASFKVMITVWRAIFLWIGLPSDAEIDLFVSCEISSIIAAAHTMYRQTKLAKGTFAARNSNKESSVTFYGRQFKIANSIALDIYKAARATFAGDLDENKFNGCFQPLLFLTMVFKDRFKSCRVTPTSKIINKNAEKTTQVQLSKYGIRGAHVVLCDGMNLAPFVTSSLAQSMGTATIIYNLINSKEKYAIRWKTALTKHIRHLPCANNIISYLTGKTASEACKVVEELLNLLLIATPRQTHRAAVPICMLMRWMSTRVAIPMEQEYSPATLVTAIQNYTTFEDDNIIYWNQSGVGMAHAYNQMCAHTYRIPGKINERFATDCSVYAIFGCSKEDLGVLRFMFGREFTKRSTMGDEFKQQGHSDKQTRVELPKM